ncbi:KAT8 regulatory NSL complex subunit 1 [Chanos chanos]|uniref:KAT8 regulatory NSL complex subunit 1 n=1 Tax=Chanos chanos TaxID=29144 RepID=A0A6J2WG27_CHACN|nr:KAT8 regulatory NSL complex subunit 1-like [Chanos chanos]
MSASAAGAGIERCGAGRPQSANRCCGGGGCGELVNGDGSSATAATATSATPAQCSDTESSVAEAQAFSEWDSVTCINADPSRNKDSLFLNGTADITREGGDCVDSGKYQRLGRCSATGRQNAGPGGDNSINIDYRAKGLQHGGERLCFMGAATRRNESRTRARLQPSATGTDRREQGTQPETEGAFVTATARCGHHKSDPIVSKRRGCSFTRASKRVCFAGINTLAYCGNSDSESQISPDGGAPVRGTAGSGSVYSQRYSETYEPRCQVDALEGRRASSRSVQGESVAASSKFSLTAGQAGVAGGSYGINDMKTTDGPACRTAKGRVRLYRVRSYLASSLEYHTDVSSPSGGGDMNGNKNGDPDMSVHTALTSKQVFPSSTDSERDLEQKQLQNQQLKHRGRLKKSLSPSCTRTHSSARNKMTPADGGVLNGTKSALQSLSRNSSFAMAYNSSGERAEEVVGGAGLEGPTAELMNAVQDEAGRRQVELQARMEHLWRRLQAVQVKQVERHVTQQLRGLWHTLGWNCPRRPSALSQSSAELNRLAHSCSEVLRAAEGALDSDHTASSSGGSSESEGEQGSERRGHSVSVSSKTIRMTREWQWAVDRAWLGSRWVWLHAQVSDLEYRIRALTELYTHLRQGKVRSSPSGPGSPLRAQRHASVSQPPRSSPVDDPLRKRQTEEPPPLPQTQTSPSLSAARVRPLPQLRPHRLIRLNGSAALGSKFEIHLFPQMVALPCWCEPLAVCVLCGGKPPRPPSDREESVSVRRAALDACVHPVLSLPSESPIALHSGIRPPVGLRSHNSMRCPSVSAPPPWLGRRSQASQRTGRVRRRLVCPRPPHTLPPLFNTPGGSNCRGQRGVVSPGFFSQRIIDLPSLQATPPAPDTPTQSQPLRRRRGESSFDIDNLVMPQGLAGLGARVQRLQYKEIITPSWKELDSVFEGSDDSVPLHSQSQPKKDGLEDTEEVEDLSDAVFVSRHAVCETRERSRWGNWARRRRRGRSSSFHGDSKLSSRVLDQACCSPEPRHRQRAEGEVSASSPSCMATEDQSEDEQQTVLPWERRTFPLMDAELQWLQEDEEEEEEGDEDPCAASGRSQSTDSGISVGSLELSPRTPLQFSGTESVSPMLTLTPKPAASTTQDRPPLPTALQSTPTLRRPSSQHPPSDGPPVNTRPQTALQSTPALRRPSSQHPPSDGPPVNTRPQTALQSTPALRRPSGQHPPSDGPPVNTRPQTALQSTPIPTQI